MSLSDDIKSLAFEAGFHAVGITSAEPFVEAERTLQARYEDGLLEGSGYNRTRIHLYTHPCESMSGARCIISVALSYLTDEPELPGDLGCPRGWVARFARGLDYHKALQRRLSILTQNMRSRLGQAVQIMAFADTGPMVDRSAAIRAAVGFRGKNTCVYVSEYSSWVVLAELLTDLELEPDAEAEPDKCGQCEECIKACPTGALCAPYVVNVRLCLSHVTQASGFIPKWLREKLGTRIYGCDTCQSACPLNKGAKPGNVAEFLWKEGLGSSPELIPLLNISSQEFRKRIAPTTAGWIRRTRFRRNVAIALGNTGDPAAIPALTEALYDPEPVVRGHAAWALGRLGARIPLESALIYETDFEVSNEIRAALDS
ncbi:MAG: tRNA epoxyqueuosine(34) reductase QueG [Armatimonadota bacterium]